MKEYIVKIKLLTPIWTGDENRKCTTLRETGILGSLRWWYEALIRSLGGYACDPTNTNCNNKDHCNACELFGCTGWARKFRIELSFDQTSSSEPDQAETTHFDHEASSQEMREPFNINQDTLFIGTRMKRNCKYQKRPVTGFFYNKAIVLKFVPLREITQDEWRSLNCILQIAEKHGALGARISQGNGVFKIDENNLPDSSEKFKFDNLRKQTNENNSCNLPNLKDFFFYKSKIEFKEDISTLIDKKVFWTHALNDTNFKDNWELWSKFWKDCHFLPIAYHIRDALRSLETDKNTRHDAWGELGRGSKIFVSHGYKVNDIAVEVRIWGYGVKDDIRKEIENNFETRLQMHLFQWSDNYLKNCTLCEETLNSVFCNNSA